MEYYQIRILLDTNLKKTLDIIQKTKISKVINGENPGEK